MPLAAVTGINGYVATHVVLYYLQKGWTVRGTVRSTSKVENVKSFPVYKEYFEKGQLEVVVLKDLVNGDWTPVLEGVEAVAHVAAPIGMKGDNITWADYKGPTVTGIIRLLEAAKDSPTIKGISAISSMAAAFDPAKLGSTEDLTLTENDWFPIPEEYLAAMDVMEPFTTQLWYCGAKKISETEAFQWVETNKPSWSYATIVPPMVYGPPLHILSPEGLNIETGGSLPDLVTLFSGKDLPPQLAEAWVDITDVAAGFFETSTRQKSGRFLISGGKYTWQIFADYLRKIRPDLEAYVPLGNPSAPQKITKFVDNSKSIKELGLTYKSHEEMLKETVEHFEKIGLFKIPPGAWKK
ncbi:hypothetical protein CI109_101837 [Kwoniella shandongensis]|uniref:Uncharacterized protein n=1 Tax=Kwoniella shandongensis TaxID=1734106 RepID=A0A5M6C671_9TREE|nr:uncharacterized protein CI109_001040 [Kwoniella shandongensis]KAA5530240.1 hypothetical protein CI109_001040 [Kwoniella shandongensis]